MRPSCFFLHSPPTPVAGQWSLVASPGAGAAAGPALRSTPPGRCDRLVRHLPASSGHRGCMPALWKILVGLLLTLPVAAFAMGRVVGPPDLVDSPPAANSTESPTSGPPTAARTRGPAAGPSEVASPGHETAASTGQAPAPPRTSDAPSGAPSASPASSQRDDQDERPDQEATGTPGSSGSETPDGTPTATPEETATATPEETATATPEETATEPSEDATSEAPGDSGDSADEADGADAGG